MNNQREESFLLVLLQLTLQFQLFYVLFQMQFLQYDKYVLITRLIPMELHRIDDEQILLLYEEQYVTNSKRLIQRKGEKRITCSIS